MEAFLFLSIIISQRRKKNKKKKKESFFCRLRLAESRFLHQQNPEGMTLTPNKVVNLTLLCFLYF
jgi:hypothetical protein